MGRNVIEGTKATSMMKWGANAAFNEQTKADQRSDVATSEGGGALLRLTDRRGLTATRPPSSANH